MMIRRLLSILSDQRGVALPLALMAMVVLAALVVAFAVLASTEPTIANNQLRVAQARAAAESGIERVGWQTATLGAPIPLPAAAPYDGSSFVPISVNGTQVGGYRVTVTAGPDPTVDRTVNAQGWAPTETGAGKAQQRVTAVVTRLALNRIATDTTCALCVRGDLQVGGDASIDSRADTSCGSKKGTMSTQVLDPLGGVVSSGLTTISSGSAAVYGADGNGTENELSDMLMAQPPSAFDAFAFKNADINELRKLAKANGTYYQGSVTFNAGNKMPNGIIFVDTTTGQNITPSTPTSEFASVNIQGNHAADPSGIFTGWVFVNGGLTIAGDVKINGLVYAMNDIQYTGTGTGEINGLVVSANVRDTVATTIDTNTGGNAAINFNCSYVQNPPVGGGNLPNWSVSSYREVSD